MLSGIRARIVWWVARRMFDGLARERVSWSAIKGPGQVPLPWRGPRGEVVIVTLDAGGRMTRAPVMCRNPREMLRELELEALTAADNLFPIARENSERARALPS